MRRRLGRWILTLAVTALAACGGEQPSVQTGADAGTAQPTPAAPAETGSGREMQGMPAMGGDMMAQMQAHMRAIQGLGADSLKWALPEHRQMTANMLAQMNREMRGMSAGPQWDDAVNTVREDLIRMPEMTAGELKGYMPSHEQHVNRLMELHRATMGGMKM